MSDLKYFKPLQTCLLSHVMLKYIYNMKYSGLKEIISPEVQAKKQKKNIAMHFSLKTQLIPFRQQGKKKPLKQPRL